ncbi:hypothetical protein ACFC0N_10605 [Streptomyces zaomyceticus]|uniref:hypothetical protein n=1 Tax=Streptomyces zaomyceticus TaxID=68286 RepID=UPI0035DFE9AE
MTRLLRRTSARPAAPPTGGGEAPEQTGDTTTEATTEATDEGADEGAVDATTGTTVEAEPAAKDSDRSGDGDGGIPPDEDGGAPTDGAPRRFPATWRKVVLAAVVAALLLAGSALFHGAHQLRSTPAARNHALTDAGATARVGGDVGEGLARIFSYTPTSDDAVERSVGTVLAGRAARQYTDLFAQVRAKLVEQRVTLSTQTVRTGVIELDGDSARLLVFLDQTSRRDGARQDRATATSAAAQLTVTARFQGDRWLIVDIKAR